MSWRIELPVEIDRRVDLLHDGIGAFCKAAAPHAVLHDRTLRKEDGWRTEALSRGIRLIALAAVAGIVAGAVGVYVSGRFAGNPARSRRLRRRARRLPSAWSRFAKGEVAAFQVAREPDKLSDLAFKKPDNSDATLAAFAGKTILLNLWATWCVPCRREMPALDRLEQALGGKDFQVVAVNLDLSNPARAKAFLDQIGVRQPRLLFRSRRRAWSASSRDAASSSGCRPRS